MNLWPLTQVRDFDRGDAKAWFPISFLLVAVIYTGSKSLVSIHSDRAHASNSCPFQSTRKPYFAASAHNSIFKNLTIILIAYGEVLWFGGHVTGLTLVSFFLMVGSSVIAAWSDISTTLARMSTGVAVVDPISGAEVPLTSDAVGGFNLGYAWMFVNCVASAAYVSHYNPLQLTAGSVHEKANQGDRF